MSAKGPGAPSQPAMADREIVISRVIDAGCATAKAAGIAGPTLKNEQDGAEGVLLLIDELLTPDSSRMWDAAVYQAGTTPAGFDKQYLRDWLEESGWNKEPPAPSLPPEVVEATRKRYVEALQRLTGHELPHHAGHH